MLEKFLEILERDTQTKNMTQNQCLICPEPIKLRKDLDMENLNDLVSDITQILSERST